jgi:iron complex transport system substrate-binding protein
MKKETMQRFIGWLLLGILGLILITACKHNTAQNTSYLSWQPISKECRIVKHSLGETCVPINPQRVVTLSLSTLGNVLALDIKPVGTTNEYQEEDFLASVKGKAEGITIIGRSQPNLETLLQLKPDLIIGVDWFKPIYPLLSKIAPTVLGKLDYPTWEKHLSLIAEATGKQKIEKQIWNHYYQRIKQLKGALGNHYQDKTISMIYVDGKQIYIDCRNSFNGAILSDAGLRRPISQDIDAPYGGMEISLEELEKADGDIIFVAIFAKGSNQFLNTIQKHPLWTRLKAVQKNQVYYVDVASWGATHMLGTDAVIDDLFKYLVNRHH